MLTLMAPAAAGPADMSFSYGLHVEHDYNLPATLASPQLDRVYEQVGVLF